MPGRKWTQEEKDLLATLRDEHPDLKLSTLTELFNERTNGACRSIYGLQGIWRHQRKDKLGSSMECRSDTGKFSAFTFKERLSVSRPRPTLLQQSTSVSSLPVPSLSNSIPLTSSPTSYKEVDKQQETRTVSGITAKEFWIMVFNGLPTAPIISSQAYIISNFKISPLPIIAEFDSGKKTGGRTCL
ncbi:hypothetical protein BTUL_0275g00020 [Botrytis tulipae]|uniref:Myb-like domain-containing protein n=1 Tax=Botrytis tulipae TaxID=87230 RepID=A0A4Z1E7S2_9HELO|nr:hypothetical protein BTUL_0275g00020 [Botrytis tulipae]